MMSVQPQPVVFHQPRLQNRGDVPSTHGLTRHLALILCADALILASAFAACVLKSGVAQAMTEIGALSFMSLALIAWFAVLHRGDLRCQGFLVFQAAWAYWYLLPMLLTAARGNVYLDREMHSFTALQLSQGCLAVLIAKFVSTLVYLLMIARPAIDPQRITSWLNRRIYSVPVWAVAVQLALGLAPFVISGKPLLTAILSSRSAEGIFPRNNFGGVGTGLFLFTFFLTSCTLLGFYGFLLVHKKSLKVTFLSLGLVAFAISALAISTRTMLLASVMPMLTLYLLGSPDRWRATKVVTCLVVMWFGADLLVSARLHGFLDRAGVRENLSHNLVDNDFYSELLYAMEVVPERVRFSYESPIAYALVTLIPRPLWPGKPVQENAELVMRLRINYMTGELGGSVLPGIVGQYWEVAGWLGVIAPGIWLGLAVAFSDRILGTGNWHIRYLALTFLWAVFISFRTFALSNLLPTILVGVTLLFLSRRNRSARG